MNAPLVSILMVARNAAEFIDAAILSVRQQSVSDIEIVVVDDGSRDHTAAIVRAHADADCRVRLVHGPGTGLSAVRNASLAAARGRYAVIVDSDDIIHPQHVEWLMEGRARNDVEICASNMIEFRQHGTEVAAQLFAKGALWSQMRSITPEEFLKKGMIGAREASLGYLKPLLNLDFLRSKGIFYDESLRIGEDFDLIIRSMMAGGRFLFIPQASYYYRKHAASTSHRLKPTDVRGLLAATEQYQVAKTSPIAAHVEARRNNLNSALVHLDTIAALKKGMFTHALKLLCGNSEARWLTLASLSEAFIKRTGYTSAKHGGRKPIIFSQDEILVDRLRELS